MTSEFKPLVESLSGTLDPAHACERFTDLPYVLFLDSAAPDHPDAHYSFLTADPACIVRSKGEVTELWRRPGGVWTSVPDDALSVARGLLPPGPVDAIQGLPPFQAALQATSATTGARYSSGFRGPGSTIFASLTWCSACMTG